MNKKKISRLIAATLASNVLINMSSITTQAIIREANETLLESRESSSNTSDGKVGEDGGYKAIKDGSTEELPTSVEEGNDALEVEAEVSPLNEITKEVIHKSNIFSRTRTVASNKIDFSKFVYLTDISYDRSSYASSGGIKVDKAPNGSNIRLLVGDEVKTFTKGLGAHAGSMVMYDISGYSDDYTRLSFYAGIDYSQHNSTGTNADGVLFKVLGSVNGTDWVELKTPFTVLQGGQAEYVNVDVRGYNYIKLEANTNKSNWFDHSVYADIRLLKEGYDITQESEYVRFNTVEEYDAELSKRTVQDNYENHKQTILEREFVNRVGYNNIVNYAKSTDGVAAALDWLLDDKDALQLYIEAGTFNFGNGERAIKALGRLYKAYGNLVGDEGDAYVYKKMLIATAVAYSRQILTYTTEFHGNHVESDPLNKFAIYKEFYDNDLLLKKDEFKNYKMELMRYVMDAKIDDNDIYWLRMYTQDRYPDNISERFYPYNYMKYLNGNYKKESLYDLNKEAEWDEKYSLSKYRVTGYGQKYRYRLWMFFEEGGVCWGISGAGLNIQQVHGIAGVNIYQPGHEAYLTYSENNDGQGIWSIGNTIGNWEDSFTYWYSYPRNQARLLLGWGNKSYSNNSRNNGSYILLAQGALNRYDDFIESMYYNLLANSYENGSKEREECYNKALEHLEINLDSIDGLIESYKASNKSSEDWFELGKRISEVYKYYPLPMVEAIDRILPYVTDSMQNLELNLLKTNSLYDAKQATDSECLQADACRRVANSLLGTKSFDLASFSFDGEDAGVIKLHENYDGMDVRIKYSLDGGNSYKEVQGTRAVLSQEEINSITADNDILVGLVGASAIFKIDIQEGKVISTKSLMSNDTENIFVGDVSQLQYSLDGGNTWNDYIGGLDTDIRFNGYQVVKVRYKAHGTTAMGNVDQYTFHEDNDNEAKSYIPLRYVSLHTYSSQQNGTDSAAQNMLDGSPFTMWHNKWAGEDDKYYSVKFDKVRYISEIKYLPRSDSGNGRLQKGYIYTSMDGETWTRVHEFWGVLNTNAWQTITLPKAFEAKYVKIVATGSYGNNPNRHFSGRMWEFYEDATKTYEADVDIKYSTTEATNKSVVAELVLPEGCKSDETSYVFDKNGTHEFTYTDANGEVHTITAEVKNIDKSIPTMEYDFDIKDKTNKDVTMTITGFNKDGVRVIDVSDYVEEQTDEEEFKVDEGFNFVEQEIDSEFNAFSNTYTFTSNKTVVFTIQDSLGNVSKVPVTVDWIDREAPTASIEFNAKALAQGKVIARLTNISEDVKILNTENGDNYYEFTDNGEFTFKFEDKAGNVGEVTAKVDWLDVEKESEVKSIISFTGGYNSEEKPNDGKYDYIIAKIKVDESKFEIISDDGATEHVFDENGTYTFSIRMLDSDYEFDIVVVVDWLSDGDGEVPPMTNDQEEVTGDEDPSSEDEVADEEEQLPSDDEASSDEKNPNESEEGNSNNEGSDIVEEVPTGDEGNSNSEEDIPPVKDEEVPPIEDEIVPPIIPDNSENTNGSSNSDDDNTSTGGSDNDSDNSDNGSDTVLPPPVDEDDLDIKSNNIISDFNNIVNVNSVESTLGQTNSNEYNNNNELLNENILDEPNNSDSFKDEFISSNDYSDADSNNYVEESNIGGMATVIGFISTIFSAIFIFIKRLLGIDV